MTLYTNKRQIKGCVLIYLCWIVPLCFVCGSHHVYTENIVNSLGYMIQDIPRKNYKTGSYRYDFRDFRTILNNSHRYGNRFIQMA